VSDAHELEILRRFKSAEDAASNQDATVPSVQPPLVELQRGPVRHGKLASSHSSGKEFLVTPTDPDGTPIFGADNIYLHASFDRKVVQDPYTTEDMVAYTLYKDPFDDIGTGHTVVGVVAGPHQGTADSLWEMYHDPYNKGANAASWSRASQPSGYDGVTVTFVTKHYHSGNYNRLYTRDLTFDSHGHLLEISEETEHDLGT